MKQGCVANGRVTMKKTIGIALLLVLSPLAQAQCLQPAAGSVIHARYDVYNGTQRYSVDFYRGDDRVAWQRGDVISAWSQQDDQVSLLRVFPQYQRTIWYPAGDLRALGKSSEWGAVTGWPVPQENGYQRVSDQVAVVQGCEAGEFENAEGARVLWLETAGLPARIAENDTVWQLVSLEQVAESDTFARWSAWQSTDFADVGDNEADPFLRRMIALGFVEHGASGFYQADGTPMQAPAHSHAH
ncbi:hypothetical protein D4A39_05365 [Alcanivorax profundi]|uniref:Uncharacterized protein n=2 Tax=Alcanivorax profundi TaxID=2338368 RepID=A0A418XY17_9GAMM|nr:hypothetical protein D4A39_05365 [Alcanivorax profundi]